MKRTPWFRADGSYPSRHGPYEVKGFAIQPGRMLHWNGIEWGEWIDTRGGQRWCRIPFGKPGDYWRGLTQPAGEGER